MSLSKEKLPPGRDDPSGPALFEQVATIPTAETGADGAMAPNDSTGRRKSLLGDDEHLAALGHKQELGRNFSPSSMLWLA